MDSLDRADEAYYYELGYDSYWMGQSFKACDCNDPACMASMQGHRDAKYDKELADAEGT